MTRSSASRTRLQAQDAGSAGGGGGLSLAEDLRSANLIFAAGPLTASGSPDMHESTGDANVNLLAGLPPAAAAPGAPGSAPGSGAGLVVPLLSSSGVGGMVAVSTSAKKALWQASGLGC